MDVLGLLPDFQNVLRTAFGDIQLLPLATQGACSQTFLLTPVDNAGLQQIIQVRNLQYALDLGITADAKDTYGNFAPATKLLARRENREQGAETNMFLYELELIPGLPYSAVLPDTCLLNSETFSRQRRLIEDFACFISRGWHRDSKLCQGKVGSQISSKLEKLSVRLPSLRLRLTARNALKQLNIIQSLPCVLTHGDLLPSNIMVDPQSNRLRGIVDWAEAEYLPFGMCLYGLEYLLGCKSGSRKRRDSVMEREIFAYYDSAPQLRSLFWSTLAEKIPSLKDYRNAILVAKAIGTLLWFGFAWDNGAINRVVELERDFEEQDYLEKFLFGDPDLENFHETKSLRSELAVEGIS